MEFLSTIINLFKIGKWVDKQINPEPEVIEVNFNYPSTSGLQADLESKGESVHWSNESEVQGKIEQGGYSKIFMHPKLKKPVILMLKTSPQNAILLRHPKT